jgi:hypothetical protein
MTTTTVRKAPCGPTKIGVGAVVGGILGGGDGVAKTVELPR